MASPRTKPGTRKLSEVARKLVVPDGIVSTGWPAVRDTCTKRLGVGFDPWQDGAGRLILAKRADGTLATTVGDFASTLSAMRGLLADLRLVDKHGADVPRSGRPRGHAREEVRQVAIRRHAPRQPGQRHRHPV